VRRADLRVPPAFVVALFLVACGPDGPSDATDTNDPPLRDREVVEEDVQEGGADYSEVCGSAVRAAVAIGDMEDTIEDLDPAIVACSNLEEFTAATNDYPNALDVDPVTFVGNRCLYSDNDAVRTSAICSQLENE
jgi:hypothetical protein